jgi:hypothetical protein
MDLAVIENFGKLYHRTHCTRDVQAVKLPEVFRDKFRENAQLQKGQAAPA